MKNPLQRAIVMAFLLTAFAQPLAGQANTDRVLAAIPVRTSLQEVPYPIYAHLTAADGSEYVLTLVAPSMLSSKSGVTVVPGIKVLARTGRAQDFVVGLERRAGARQVARNLSEVVLDDGRHVVARANFAQTDALVAAGLDVVRLHEEPMSVVFPSERAVASAAPPAPAAADPEITAMVSSVTQTAVYDATAHLTGVQPVTVEGASYTIATRSTSSGTPIAKATQYAYERLSALGLATTFQPWSVSETTGEVSGRNVIGERTGTLKPSEILIVCAHLDSLPAAGSVAPGADDDGSGSAAVLVAAQALSSRRFEKTIRFALFTGEEQGIYGSAAYAKALKEQGANVIGVLNLDMIGWSTGAPVVRLHTRKPTDAGRVLDQTLFTSFTAAVNTYLPGALTPIETPDGEPNADSASFWYQGWPAVLVIEDNLGDFNTNYHKTTDTLDRLNLPYFTNFVKASVATAAQLATVAPAPGPDPGSESAVRFLPIVLDATGRARYTSELTLANRGTSDATVQLSYTASSDFGGQGSGTVPVSLPAGRQVVIDDTIGFLRGSGLPIPAGDQAGTIRATFSELSASDTGVAVVRVTAPSENGRAGVAYVAPRIADVPTGTTWLCGLQGDEEDRTNVALSNASETDPVTLRLTLFSGDGRGATLAFPDVTLAAGQFKQINDIFHGAPFSQGYASVSIVSPSGRYFAYAVVNDNGTNDGSFIAFEPDNPPTGTRLLPVIVEAGPYTSEIVLTNTSKDFRTVELSYVESMTPEMGAGGTAVESLAPGQQIILGDAFDYLRSHATGMIGPKGNDYSGSLTARFLSGVATAPGFAGARTGSAAKTIKGRYGVFYPAVPLTATATTEAWVFGLQQDEKVRANVSVAAPSDAAQPVTLGFEIYDGKTGLRAGVSEDITLKPGGWAQVLDILGRFGVQQGYVRAVRRSSAGRFVAYGVVNDGPYPGSPSVTDDGSYIPFANR